jgi:4-hydroxythreonine-4-phosphate dehydrogenase
MTLGITLGDPAGIGPEIVAKSLDKFQNDDLILIGSESNFKKALTALRKKAELPNNIQFADVGSLEIEPGRISKPAGEIALKSVMKGVELALGGTINALVTAPINKEAIILAGSKFIDHTAMLKGIAGAEEISTVFETRNLRIFFMTRHGALIEEIKQITREKVFDAIIQANRCLELLGIHNGRIAVSALNPHGGEGGLFGSEEKEEIEPAVKMASKSVNASGPYPADSVFHRASQGEFDMVVSLYHDQGHIAAKMFDFSKTISLTLGLPFLRTSVDHGTAFDIAGKGIADETSMIEAISKANKYHQEYKKNYERVYRRKGI